MTALSEVWIYLLGISVAANGFFASYVLLGIKSQLTGMRSDIVQLKQDQSEQNEIIAVNDFRLMVIEKDLDRLPCKKDLPCKDS